ncbi:MAG: histidine phosphatase family protein [Pyrinomonadaceae bacterium]
MKTLFLMRHAKSSWQNDLLDDFDRPLNKRGLKAAPFIGRYMRGNNMVPDAIISSPAMRAKQTAEMVRHSGEFLPVIIFDQRIYEATAPTLLEIASGLDPQAEKALMIGHNPGIEDFLYHLTGERRVISTACLSVINLNIDAWSDILRARAALVALIKPKEHMDDES